MKHRALLSLVFLATAPAALAQSLQLTVPMIMQDQNTWVGASPEQPYWTLDGRTLYFAWNPLGAFASDSLFAIGVDQEEPVRVPLDAQRDLPPRFAGWRHGERVFDASWNRMIFTRDGDLLLYDRTAGRSRRLTDTRGVETSPRFGPGDRTVQFVLNDNIYRLDLAAGSIAQLTDLRPGSAPSEDESPNDDFLTEQQKSLFDYVQKQQEETAQRRDARKRQDALRDVPPVFYTGKKRIQDLGVDPTERFVTFTLWDPSTPERTSVMRYVTENGFAEAQSARSKVGEADDAGELYVQDLERDTTFMVDLHKLPGAYDVPAFRRDGAAAVDSAKTRRDLYPTWIAWSGDGAYAVVEVRAADNKDRWLARLHPETGALTVLDRQTDDAWVAGPGISWSRFGSNAYGWMSDNRHFYFQSEATGYSHLYAVDVETGAIQALTSGPFEVFDPMLSRDGKTWFFTSSEGSPFERHFYAMPAAGGKRTRLTTMPGNNEVTIAPDERTLAIRHSYSNKPPEIHLAAGRTTRQITHSTTEAWNAYAWRDPDIMQIEASDGARVPARIYRPETPNGGAVLFVHGAGYLQNVHRWWSSYQREYMFHNLLADRGYLVLDVDYRGSSGYGRDWRTAIYRHMGGRDLQDFVDASRYAESAYGIDPERVFIYGGSYGGFITLMALFTEPEHFGGGAALRSVTDWAHYNHPYTANILNTPETDSLAYARSSPIYFAGGLQDPLLIAHGMVDTNVHFQDVVRLAQRLIELGKTGWEMAVYPVENHGFTEPSSWTDEYRRILALIETTVGPAAAVPAPVDAGGND
ncbi:MAG: prolyl oligopeptidase family serine peptidase [Rhodothermales bacterium]